MDREPVGHIQITLINKETIPTHFMELSAVKNAYEDMKSAMVHKGFVTCDDGRVIPTHAIAWMEIFEDHWW